MTDFIYRALRFATAVALSLCVGALPAFPQAALLPNAKQTFLDQNGNPLSLGKVYTYVPNTASPKATWLDSTQTQSNTNPVVLDAAGRAVIFGQGNYSQKVTDASDNQQWNALTTAYGSSAPTGATGTDTAPVGSLLPFSGFTVPTNWQFAYGQAVSRTTFTDLLAAITVTDTSVNCTSGSATVSGWADTSQLAVGSPVEATCISTGVTVKSVTNATTIVMSANATSTATVLMTAFPWGNGDGTTTFNVPDLRGRTLVGPDAMGGTAANRLQVTTTLSITSGSATATAGSATGLARGMFIVNPGVPVGTTVSAMVGTTVTMSANATATTNVSTRFSMLTDAQAPAGAGGAASRVIALADLPAMPVTDPGHFHTVVGEQSGNPFAGNLNPGVNPTAGTPIVTDSKTTGITVNAGANNTATPLVQPALAVNYIVKMAPNTTGLGGVVSVGGMFGDILCGVNVTCTAQTISFSGTPVLTQNHVYVGNASNQAVDVAMAGDCTIVAAGTITCLNTNGVPFTTAATTALGTSGATIPLLSTANTWGATQVMSHLTVEGVTSTGATGTGKFVFDGTPTLVTPVLGAATATSINKVALTQPAAAATLTIANNKTLTANASTTLAGTDGKTLTISNSGTLAGGDAFTLAIAAGKTLTASNSGTLAGGDAFVLAIAATKTLTVSKSLTLDGTDGTTMSFPSVSATIPRVVASGSSTLNTAAIASTTCNTTTVAATGTLTTDRIAATFNGSTAAITGYAPVTTGALSIRPYPTADNVNFEVCNSTAASITPGATTLNWGVTR